MLLHAAVCRLGAAGYAAQVHVLGLLSIDQQPVVPRCPAQAAGRSGHGREDGEAVAGAAIFGLAPHLQQRRRR